MKRKLIMQVHMKCEKCRSKALQVAAEACGVNYVGVEGAEKDKVVVIGEGIDAANLTKSMRKKLGNAKIISVQEMK